jgi:hypothetical protein
MQCSCGDAPLEHLSNEAIVMALHESGGKMDKAKNRPSPDLASDEQGRPARKSTEIQPVKKDDVALETYEQSPERPGGDERNRPATPDGPMPDRMPVMPPD